MNDVLEPPDEPRHHSSTTAARDRAGRHPDTPSVDVGVFSAFYRAEVKDLVNFLLWMGAGLADAADLAQETMIDAYRSWSSIKHPRAWIRRVASRKYARWHFGPEPITDASEQCSPLLRAPDEIGAWQQRHEVLRLLATLPWRQRQVLAWTLDGYEPQEIAAELGVTPEAVRSSLKLARRKLAERPGDPGEAE